jgi:hypothetical protein
MKMRIKLIVSSIIFLSVVISAGYYGMSVLAARKGIPQNTCADLQRIANKAWKEDGIVFQGFEKLPMQTDVYIQHEKERTDRLCQLGYFTKVSPMGKQICQGYIYTNTESTEIRSGYGRFRTSFYDRENSESEYCRYIN